MKCTRRSILRSMLAGGVFAGWPRLSTAQPECYLPRIVEPWWTVAGNPELGKFTTERQEPVDFCVWRARDGAWQLWSCIRNTDCGGHSRLFHGWEGAKLKDTDWTPKGIVMESDPHYGEIAGGLQAPHVIQRDGKYHLFYGNWQAICRAESEDGKSFARVVQPDGTTELFREKVAGNEERFGTRDAMLLAANGQYYCYYAARHPRDPARWSAVYARTATDFDRWSESTLVHFGGPSGQRLWSMECPHVVHRHGRYYLFVTQNYKGSPRSQVYCSEDPLQFGIEEDTYHVGELPVAAMEIVRHEGQDYIAALKPDLDGIRVARLDWERG